MALFLGYDPGGKDKNGVVAVEIDEDGSLAGEPEHKVLCDADEVRDWLDGYLSAKAIGIDTLLAWSFRGRRDCDDALRERYKKHGQTVVQQNSLYSAMTLNGALVALAARDRGLPLIESHPKLLLKANLLPGDLVARHKKLKREYAQRDHVADALVAAWCASRWHFKRWRVNLYEAFGDSKALHFPAGDACYPWPEAVPCPD